MERWRWLDLDRQGPYENAATMPVLVRTVAEHRRPVVVTSVWGVTHLNVGWFDDVDATLDLDRCAEIGIPVIRRAFYGGGTAYYEAECSAMWGFLLPHDSTALGMATSDLDGLLRRFQAVWTGVLSRIGLDAVRFEGSSDLRWHGRKLGGLTAQDLVACVSIGGFLNLRRPDLTGYLQVVRIPDGKFEDKAVTDMSEYVCTAEEVAGRPVAYEEVRDALRSAMVDAGIELVPDVLSPGERKGVAAAADRVSSPDAIRRVSSERFRAAAPPGSRVGFGNHKGRKLCRAGVAVDGAARIAAAMMAGDLHASPPDVLDRVAAVLAGVDARNGSALRAAIAGVFEGPDVHQADEVMGVTTDDLVAAVQAAVDAALAAEPAQV